MRAVTSDKAELLIYKFIEGELNAYLKRPFKTMH